MTQIPEMLEHVVPNAEQLWDPSLPAAVNITRLVGGEDAASPSKLQSIRNDDRSAPTTTTTERDQENLAVAESNGLDSAKVDFDDILCALRCATVDDKTSPLNALQQQLVGVFQHGPLRAGGLFAVLSEAAERGTTVAATPACDIGVPWNSCKAAATLVTLLACPPQRLREARAFQSSILGGLPSYEHIRSTPSASLLESFRNAKSRARGEQRSTTLISVSLTDVHIFEVTRQPNRRKYTSYAHTFVLGIGPEGVIIWQGWGKHGYGLDQYIARDGARIRTWQEAGDFVDRFEKFAAYKGKWDSKRNKLYKQCFEVDILDICGDHGPSDPIVPQLESWVRLLVLEDVKLGDLSKFEFV